MQEDYFDYYNEPEDTGCCLNCSSSYKGCLCFDCKCKRCFWYSYNYDFDKGSCDYINVLKKERQKEWEEQQRLKQEQNQRMYKESGIDYSKIGLKKGQTQLIIPTRAKQP